MDDKYNNEDQEAFQVIDTTETIELELEEKPKSSSIKEFLNYIVLIAVAFFLAQVIHRYIFTPVTVDGRSMQATLQDRDYLFLWRMSKIKRFDVVVFEYENDDLIKRVIGLPGDNVEVSNNTLYINGKEYSEPYLEKRKSELSYPSIFTSDFTLQEVCELSNINCDDNEIPEGYILVLGDNRPESKDSRMIGLVPKDKVLGKALYILYPFNRIGKIE